MAAAWSLLNFFKADNGPNQGAQTPSQPLYGIDGAAQFVAPQRLRDVAGKLKVSQSQNIYDADFEYGSQPLRWENFILNTSGQASIVSDPTLGGVTMKIGSGAAPGDITIRQSRPYHRYQPGKTMYMASNVNFGASVTGQTQRVGFFDDNNGVFFQQSGATSTTNPYAMNVVVRSDSGGVPVDTVIAAPNWNGNLQIRDALDWTRVQMIWMEYAWYGAGALRWGVIINAEPYVLHQIGTGNSAYTGSPQLKPWSRTGNLPVRYEQRDPGTGVPSTMTHYGVSVIIEGANDKQRGFTYAYGATPVTANRVVGGTLVSGVAISAITPSSGVVTATVASQTNLPAVGTPVTITGSNIAGYNGTFVITASTATTISWNSPATGVYSGSGATLSYYYNTAAASGLTNTQRFPLSSFRMRAMGVNIFDNVVGGAVSSATNNTLTIANSGAVGSGTVSSVAGQFNNGRGLLTFSAIHKYNQNLSANANAPAQFITLSSFTLVGTAASTNISVNADTSLNIVTVASGGFTAGQVLTGTGTVANSTITKQLTAFSTSAVSQTFSSGGLPGANSITFGAVTSVAVGQYVIGTGIPAGTIVLSIATNTVTFSNNLTVQAAGSYTFYSMTASQAYSSGGAVGTSTVTLAAVTNFAVGQYISGFGLSTNTLVTGITGTTLILGANFTAQAAGQYSASAAGSTGAYAVSATQGVLSGTITATLTYPAATYLVQTVPSTTTLTVALNLPNGVSATTNPTATYWGVNQHAGRSLYYQAVIGGGISSATAPSASTVAGVSTYSSTITFNSAHNLNTGDVIYITGATPAAWNGIYSVTLDATIPATKVSINLGTASPGSYSSGATVTSPYTARITSNTVSTLTFSDIVTGLPIANSPTSATLWQVGVLDRGQLLPQTLLISTSATCLVELIASTPTNQISLSGANFVQAATLGAYNSFAEVDNSSGGLSGGEVVYSFSTPNNALQQLDLTSFFPVLTNIRGNVPDILTVAISTSGSNLAIASVNVVCQEAMS